ncbi:MAG: hypothetical protein E6J02_06040 [Chloroflexi bacterium]|nr:MAG: hypothetical protein E6J02_06040 [Chloroflexota bacterium]
MPELRRVRSIGEAIHHRRLLIAATVMAFLLAGALIVRVTPPTYQADAELNVDTSNLDPALDASPGLIPRYYAQLATSPRILKRAAVSLGIPVDRRLLDQVQAEAIQSTPVVVIHAQASSGPRAASIANAVAKAVVDQNREDQTAHPSDATAYLANQLAQLDGSGGAPADPVHRRGVYDALQQQRVAQARSADRVALSQAAVVPSRPRWPDPVRYLLVALLAGMAVALLGALFLEQLDDRLFTTEALALAAGTRLAVGVDRPRPGAPPGPPVFTLAKRRIVAPSLCSRTVLVVAASASDRAAGVAGALGRAAWDEGDSVLVVNSEGEESFGDEADGPARLLSRTPEQLLSLTEASFGQTLTLVAVPSPREAPMAATLARRTDGAILVATARRTRASEVRRTATALRAAGVVPLAAFLLAPGAST